MAPSEDISPPPLKRQRLLEPDKPAVLASSIPSRTITELGPNQLRIFSWNVNGIGPFLQTSITSFFEKDLAKSARISPSAESVATPTLRGCLKRWNFPSIVCLQEVKIARGDERTKAAIRNAVKASSSKHDQSASSAAPPEPGYSAFFALPRDKFNARGFGGKIYGVCMLIREELLPKGETASQKLVQNVSWDLEGRVLLLEVPSIKLVVINVYAVNGTDNPYKDPTTGKISGTRHDKKRVVHNDLAATIRDFENRGWHTIVAGDLNIARTPFDGFPGIRQTHPHVVNRTDFESKFMSTKEDGGLGMLDTFRLLHGNERKYSYRPRGIVWGSSCDRVDLILASKSAKPCLLESDILDEVEERGPSDHVPLYVTLDLNKLPTLKTRDFESPRAASTGILA